MTPDSHRHLSTWAAGPRCVVGDGKALAGTRVHTIGASVASAPPNAEMGMIGVPTKVLGRQSLWNGMLHVSLRPTNSLGITPSL